MGVCGGTGNWSFTIWGSDSAWAGGFGVVDWRGIFEAVGDDRSDMQASLWSRCRKTLLMNSSGARFFSRYLVKVHEQSTRNAAAASAYAVKACRILI